MLLNHWLKDGMIIKAILILSYGNGKCKEIWSFISYQVKSLKNNYTLLKFLLIGPEKYPLTVIQCLLKISCLFLLNKIKFYRKYTDLKTILKLSSKVSKYFNLSLKTKGLIINWLTSYLNSFPKVTKTYVKPFILPFNQQTILTYKITDNT